MTTEQGANAGGNPANSNEQLNPQANTNGGGSNADVEALKKELASRDKKIQELLDADKARAEEAEKQRLANLSAEEKLAEIQAKLDSQEKRAEYLSLGLTAEQAQTVLNATTETEKAKLIFEFASAKSVESFKKEQLEKIPKEPNPKNNNGQIDVIEQAFRKGLRI